MLREFSIKNFGPFKERAVLSMESTKLRDHADTVVPDGGGLLTSALIFGANASGKSYFLKAFSALVRIMGKPYANPVRFPWYEPFRLSKGSLGSPTEIGLKLLIEGIDYEYSVAYTENTIVSESLYHYPKGRRAAVFVRTGPEEYSRADKVVKTKTTPASSYLVVASEYNDKVCQRFRSEVLEKIVVLDDESVGLAIGSCAFLEDHSELKDFALKALKIADTGIVDYSYSEKELSPRAVFDDGAAMSARVKDGKLMVSDIRLMHDLETDGVEEDRTAFPLDIESAGTKEMLGTVGPLVDALSNGKLLIIDGLGAFLHPLLTHWIVRQFSNGSNPHHAQLIANTHDLGLMDIKDLVRRDQIWFTNRDRRTGASDLYSLADFKDVRQVGGLAKAYLLGRFDAVPAIRSRDVME